MNLDEQAALVNKERKEIKTYKLTWFDGRVEEITGSNIHYAFTKAGYGAGAIVALDWYEEIKEKPQ